MKTKNFIVELILKANERVFVVRELSSQPNVPAAVVACCNGVDELKEFFGSNTIL